VTLICGALEEHLLTYLLTYLNGHDLSIECLERNLYIGSQITDYFRDIFLHMTLTFGRDPRNVKVNQRIKHLGQRFRSKIIVRTQRQKDTHTPDRLLYLNH